MTGGGSLPRWQWHPQRREWLYIQEAACAWCGHFFEWEGPPAIPPLCAECWQTAEVKVVA